MDNELSGYLTRDTSEGFISVQYGQLWQCTLALKIKVASSVKNVLFNKLELFKSSNEDSQ